MDCQPPLVLCDEFGFGNVLIVTRQDATLGELLRFKTAHGLQHHSVRVRSAEVHEVPERIKWLVINVGTNLNSDPNWHKKAMAFELDLHTGVFPNWETKHKAIIGLLQYARHVHLSTGG